MGQDWSDAAIANEYLEPPEAGSSKEQNLSFQSPEVTLPKP